MATALDELLRSCSIEITRRARAAGSPVVLTGAENFASAVAAMQPLEASATTVPVVELLAHVPVVPFAPMVAPAAQEMPWTASRRLGKGDDGSTVALGLVNEVRELGAVTCGFMLLAPNARYPEHAHPPHEIYLPIAGNGQWRYGGHASYRALEPDSLVYNSPKVTHGAIAGDQLLLALYVLWPEEPLTAS